MDHSAIDFDMVMELLPNPKGDRVKSTNCPGNSCPSQYDCATGKRADMASRKGRLDTQTSCEERVLRASRNHESPMAASFRRHAARGSLRLTVVLRPPPSPAATAVAISSAF